MSSKNTLALDVGKMRVGVAYAHADVSVPVPLPTINRQDTDFWSSLADVLAKYDIGHIVIGLPRGLDGQETAQSTSTREFAKELETRIQLPFEWQDEALTSVKAKAELHSRGKPYNKADVDALAACFILSDFLEDRR